MICLRRENAVKKLLDILGPEDPVIARSLDPFLLRGCYGVDVIHNAIHGNFPLVLYINVTMMTSRCEQDFWLRFTHVYKAIMTCWVHAYGICNFYWIANHKIQNESLSIVNRL